MARDWIRTCRKCGHQWPLPAALAKARPPSQADLLGRRMQATGPSVIIVSFSKARDHLKLVNAEQQRDQFLGILPFVGPRATGTVLPVPGGWLTEPGRPGSGGAACHNGDDAETCTGAKHSTCLTAQLAEPTPAMPKACARASANHRPAGE